jgi:hypothetical protein
LFPSNVKEVKAVRFGRVKIQVCNVLVLIRLLDVHQKNNDAKYIMEGRMEHKRGQPERVMCEVKADGKRQQEPEWAGAKTRDMWAQ